MRLACCWPLAYDGASRTIVHTCAERYEEPYTKDEWAEYLGHPVVYKTSHLRVVTQPVTSKPKKKRRVVRERWNVGFRDPAWEDFG